MASVTNLSFAVDAQIWPVTKCQKHMTFGVTFDAFIRTLCNIHA